MKRVFTFLLALSLLMCSSVTAYAAEFPETVGKNESAEIDVTAKYSSSTVTPTVYSVDISWSNMTFTYTQEDTKTWNAADHSYETSTKGEWDKTSATVTVTNHSNAAVQVDVEYTPVQDTGVTGTLTNTSAALNAGEEGNYSGAESLTATLTISGKPNSTVSSSGIKIGTIKVTIK